jgi:outer membrane protein OmpA-like peptidoglycan-associated protein
MRWTLLTLIALMVLTRPAAAQFSVPGMDPESHIPLFGMPTQKDDKPDSYRRLPYRDLASEIRIEVAADTLYDFERAEVRKNAEDYMQQAANLIFEHAKGPVRVECRSDRLPPAAAQKLAQRCAAAVTQWLVVQERLNKVKFNTVGSSVVPAVTPNRSDPFAPVPGSQSSILIVFAKQ